MTLFSGKCEGGPFHGKSLYHGEDHIDVAMQNDKVVTHFRFIDGAPDPAYKFGAYLHVDGEWKWCKDGIE